MIERMVGGGLAVDASVIRAEANLQRLHSGDEGLPSDLKSRAVDPVILFTVLVGDRDMARLCII